MMRKNVKRAPPKAKGGMSSLTMYRSRTSDLTALLYHSHVDRPSRELLTVALVLAALAGLGGAAALLATIHREGQPVVSPAAPAPDGAPQFVTAWEGASSGRGTRALRLELARQAGDSVRVVWSTAELFPQGLVARSYTVRPKEIRVRYELRYPGWTPGCDAQTEGEDVYRLATDTGVFARPTRTYHQPWHQELHAAVWRLLEALGVGDEATLAALVPDARLRRRLPPELRAEPACDAPEDGPTPRTVSVPASEGRTPWELVFRRTADGWRLTRATQVLP